MQKDITAAVITIGDEILIGQITDTNSKYLAEKLSENGIKTISKFSVGDNKEAISETLEFIAGKTDIVILTGGLGPTKDDITKKTLADFFNCTLTLHPEALDAVTLFFKKRNKELSDINREQAFLPSSCMYIPNLYGTAPAMWFEKNNQVFISLPGVPFEMKHIIEEEILRRLKSKFSAPAITHRIIRTVGIGESFLAEKIEAWEAALPENIKLAYLPEAGQVKLRLSMTGSDIDSNERIISEEVNKLKSIAGKFIFAYENISLEEALGNLLNRQGATLATAESCTGGAIAAAITSISGSSAYFKGSIVAYDNTIKENSLSVNPETLQKHGAVSEQVVLEMAENVRKKMNTTYALSCSGIAGPSGGTKEKPVGTVWIACAGPDGIIAKKFMFGWDRIINIRFTVVAALDILRQRMEEKA